MLLLLQMEKGRTVVVSALQFACTDDVSTNVVTAERLQFHIFLHFPTFNFNSFQIPLLSQVYELPRLKRFHFSLLLALDIAHIQRKHITMEFHMIIFN